MEVRVKEVIINVDRQGLGEHDVAFITHQANLIIGYLHSSPQLKRIAHIMMAETGVTLAKLALFDDQERKKEDEKKGGDNGKNGPV